MRKLKHLAELALVLPFYLLLRILPLSVASFTTGWLVRLLGRFHLSHQTALANLAACFPEKSAAEVKRIALASWENLGRTAGELPHITSYSNSKVQELCPISGLENVEEAENYSRKKGDGGLLLISAHIGNWELASRMLLVRDPQTALIYRHANNPYVEKLIQRMRGGYTSFIIRKGDASGMRDIVRHLKKGGTLGMLADQKMTGGTEVTLFDKKILAPAAAGELSAKYDIPIVMGRCIRDEKDKTSYVLRYEAPIYANGRTAQQITQDVYNIYQKWLRENPTQWFWQHNRFGLAKK